jgi:hypothetical protein
MFRPMCRPPEGCSGATRILALPPSPRPFSCPSSSPKVVADLPRVVTSEDGKEDLTAAPACSEDFGL